MTYHSWEDESVDWAGIEDAAYFIGGWLIRWVRLPVMQMKEKFGTARVYCSFGWSSFYSIWRPQYFWVPNWYPWKLDLRLSPWVLPFLNRVGVPIQEAAYRSRYKAAIKKWPHLKEEILCGADRPELLEGL